MQQILWGRSILAGIAAEVVVFAVVFPVLWAFGQQAFLVSILIASAASPFVFALWVNRRARSHFVMHGLIVGVMAAVVYFIVSRGQPEPLLYKIAHGLKVVGGFAGGVMSSVRFNRESARLDQRSRRRF